MRHLPGVRAMSGIIFRTVPNIMQAYGCSEDTAGRYCDLRTEGYSREQALLMAGLSDPPDNEAPSRWLPCWVCNRPMDGLSEADCHCFHRKERAPTPDADQAEAPTK